MSSSMLVCVLSTLAAAPLPDGWQTRPLTDEDLIEFSSEELRQLRNEIYARHGYVFKSADLAEHFRQQPWYKPKPAFNPAAAGAVTPTEKANVELIKRIEEGRQAYETKDDTNQILQESDTVRPKHFVGRLTVIQDDGSLEASPYDLVAQFSCRLDVKTPTSKLCGCGHRLDVYDPRLRIRVASESADLPPPRLRADTEMTEALASGAFVPCPSTQWLAKPLSLGTADSAKPRGQLLGVEYLTLGDIPQLDPDQVKQRCFALTSTGTLRRVTDIQGFYDRTRQEKDYTGNEVSVSSTAHTDVVALPTAPSDASNEQPVTLRATTHITTKRYPRPRAVESSYTDKVRTLQWSPKERRFKELVPSPQSSHP